MWFTDVKIKIPERGFNQGCEWRHAPEACTEDFGRFEKVSSWVLRSEEEGWLSLARSGLMAGATRVGWGADGKASIERLCLSPSVEKPFNSKVIKSFVPELRRRKCFSCFGIPMLRTFYVRFAYPYHVYVIFCHIGWIHKVFSSQWMLIPFWQHWFSCTMIFGPVIILLHKLVTDGIAFCSYCFWYTSPTYYWSSCVPLLDVS